MGNICHLLTGELQIGTEPQGTAPLDADSAGETQEEGLGDGLWGDKGLLTSCYAHMYDKQHID